MVTLDEPAAVLTPPWSVRWVLRLVAALIVFGAVATVAAVLMSDDLIRHWAMGNPAARQVLETQGLEALKNPPEGQVAAPQIVRVTVVLYITVAMLLWVLGIFFRNGFEWARIGFTAILIFTVTAGLAGIGVSPLPLFIAVIVVCIVVCVAVLVLLWAPATSRFIHRDRPAAMAAAQDG